MRAAQSQAPWGESALAELCRLYWYPLYTFARRRGRSPEDAQDLTQSFFLHMVEHRAFKGVDRLKGKFRSFLLASFQNHLSDAADRARRLKRGGNKVRGLSWGYNVASLPRCGREHRRGSATESSEGEENWR